MRGRAKTGALAVALGALAAAAAAAQDATSGATPTEQRLRGAKVTFERLVGADAAREVDAQRARLLSLCVERGETPSPLLSPGMFRATYRASLSLPVRDRHGFRVEGRGSVKLSVNGEVVLEGVLRPGKPIETAQAARLKKGDNELQLVFESGAMGDGQFRLSWSGADFGFEPIAPERLSWIRDEDVAAGERVRLGHQLFAERRCSRCHEAETRRVGESAFGELDITGPDLRNVGGRVRHEWLAAWLRDPRRFRPDATMPKVRFEKDRDADDIAAFLASLGAPFAAPQFPGGTADAGASRFRQLGCIACHTSPGSPRAEARLGDRIPLDFVHQKWQPAALVAYLQDPRRDHAHVRMPDFGLSRDDSVQLAAYLLTVPGEALPPSRGDAEHGRKLAIQHGCADCHALELPIVERRPPRLRNLKPERGCLAIGGQAGVDHGLSPEQVHALRSFLPFAEEAPFRRAPTDFVARQLSAQRCTACHALDGQPSVWARVAEVAGGAAPLPPDEDPVAQGLPALTWVGAKLQPSWLARFVTGKEKSPRPWLHARMPAFARHGEAIAAGLVREHGYGPQDEPPAAADVQSAIHGERLLAMGKGFGCVQCHALGDQPAVQVFERAGIELLTARSRLRHEYFTRWLRDPPRLDPDSRMPKYADARGRTAITEVLGGDATQQFEAIWQFLGSKLPGGR